MYAYIGLGSNLSDPVEQVKTAIYNLQSLPDSDLIDWSSLYASSPMGPQDQPDYINAVAVIDTTLSAHQLLDALQAIEQNQGRIRKRHWGERTLDLDILLYGQKEINAPRLQVPHPGVALRAFVLYPLAEISPNLTIPNVGNIEQLLQHCPRDGLRKLEKITL
jgi:2-amino-4-hydroxy-6-hydroxymethyldihydropteridine diphosphokinase